MPDPSDREILERIEAELRQCKERQKVTARAVADLAIGLNSGERQARDRHQELLGVALGQLAERKVAERTRKNSDDYTDKFKIPGGQGSVELTRGAQKRIVKWVLLGVFAVGLHAVQFVWERVAEHRAKPVAEAKP